MGQSTIEPLRVSPQNPFGLHQALPTLRPGRIQHSLNALCLFWSHGKIPAGFIQHFFAIAQVARFWLILEEIGI